MRAVVVAGEPSGDRALAAVVRALGVESFGIGGDALEEAGARLLAHVRDVSGMGVAELASRAPAIAQATARLLQAIAKSPPEIALLASWSAANARIGALLRRRGIRVVWISPPEVWAWGARRASKLAKAADRLVVTLPFEEGIWRQAGGEARYLGHPALDVAMPSRAEIRRALGIAKDETMVALLPGSRAGEIERLLPVFAETLSRMGDVRARVVMAPSLPQAVKGALERSGLAVLPTSPHSGALGVLPAFDAALVASGTASLECALARVPPVIAYRLHPLTMALAKRLVRTPHIGLPNVVLGRAAFPERIQEAATAQNLARDVTDVLRDPRFVDACAEVEAKLRAGLPEGSWAARVAGWIGADST